MKTEAGTVYPQAKEQQILPTAARFWEAQSRYFLLFKRNHASQQFDSAFLDSNNVGEYPMLQIIIIMIISDGYPWKLARKLWTDGNINSMTTKW